MLMPLIAVAALTLSAPDTLTNVFLVTRGDRLDVETRNGNVAIRTTTTSSVRVTGGWRGRLSHEGGVLKLDGNARRGWTDETDLVLEVPLWMPLAVQTQNGDVNIDAADAHVDVQTLAGNVTVRNAKAGVSLHAISGDLRVLQSAGRLELNSVNGGILVIGADGPVMAATVNDDITLAEIRSDQVAAETVNGEVRYAGALEARGRYTFSSHNGDITLHLPGTPDALVSVATYSGEFESDWPLTLTERRGGRFSVPLGRGAGARVDLESFQGSIRLSRRAMTLPAARN